MKKHGADEEQSLAGQKVNRNGDGHAPSDGGVPAARIEHELPGDVQRRIASGEAPDPIWYVGRIGPSVQDVLDADGEELARLTKREQSLPSNGNGNGHPPARNRRRRQAPA